MQDNSFTFGVGRRGRNIYNLYIYFFFLSQQQNKTYFPDEEKHVLPCLITVNKTGCGEKKTYSNRHNYPRLPHRSLSCNCVKQGSKKLVETEKHVFP